MLPKCNLTGDPQNIRKLHILLTAEVRAAQSYVLFYGAAMLQILRVLAVHESRNVLLVRPLAYFLSFNYRKYLESHELRNQRSARINNIEEKATVTEQFILILTLRRK